MDDNNIPALDYRTPPATVREVGIHLIYISKNMVDISKKLDEMSGKFAYRQELLDAIAQHKEGQAAIIENLGYTTARVEKLENFNNRIAYRIAGYAIIALVLMVLSVYGINNLFK